jgi:rod shape-determining protein MreC
VPRKLTAQGKGLLFTAAVFAAWWLIPLFFKTLTKVTFYEFQAPSLTALSYLNDLQEYWSTRNHSKNELIEAGAGLARLNAHYELRNQEATQWQNEVARLEALLNLPRLPTYRYEVARVIRRDMNAWWQHLIIRKGSRNGIEEGQAVVYAGGVVGRVREVHLYTAVVELLTSPRFRVAAHLDGDLRPVQFQGGDNQPLHGPEGLLSNVPPDVQVEDRREPLRIVSSRLGGVFPDGLTLGFVERLEPEKNGLFQVGAVRLDPRLLSLREVAVLVPLLDEETLEPMTAE